MTSPPKDVVFVPASQLQSIMVRTLINHGATEEDASTQADLLLEGELRGQPSHGLRRLQVVASRLANGVSTSGLEPKLTWTAPTRLQVDGMNGLGPTTAHRTIAALTPVARKMGVALGAIQRSGHLGMLSPYAESIARDGYIGILLTTSEALVAPWGGSRAILGTNPIGIGIPTNEQPFLLDMSTAAAAAGKIIDYAEREEPIPLGWALDKNGEATTDASAAVEGAILPFGGTKGYGLGLAFEALVGLLAGSAFGSDVHGTLDTDHRPTKGDVIILISPGSAPGLLTPLTDFFRLLRGEGQSAGQVLIPGDRSRELRSERLRDGIPIDRTLWEDSLALSEIDPGKVRK